MNRKKTIALAWILVLTLFTTACSFAGETEEQRGESDYQKIELVMAVNGTDNMVRYFREMQYYWPIPWDEIRRHGIPQNPSWLEM